MDMANATDQSTPENASPPMRLMARQPIFDAQEKLVAYELLARRGALDTDEKQDYATSDIIEQIANLGGLGPITDNHPAFINLTREALLSERYTVLPKGRVVYELLEHVTLDREVIRACKALRAKGYRLALDDVSDLEAVRPLLDHVDLVKVDFALTDADEQERMVHELKKHGVTLLAEKIETRDNSSGPTRWASTASRASSTRSLRSSRGVMCRPRWRRTSACSRRSRERRWTSTRSSRFSRATCRCPRGCCGTCGRTPISCPMCRRSSRRSCCWAKSRCGGGRRCWASPCWARTSRTSS